MLTDVPKDTTKDGDDSFGQDILLVLNEALQVFNFSSTPEKSQLRLDFENLTSGQIFKQLEQPQTMELVDLETVESLKQELIATGELEKSFINSLSTTTTTS